MYYDSHSAWDRASQFPLVSQDLVSLGLNLRILDRLGYQVAEFAACCVRDKLAMLDRAVDVFRSLSTIHPLTFAYMEHFRQCLNSWGQTDKERTALSNFVVDIEGLMALNAVNNDPEPPFALVPLDARRIIADFVMKFFLKVDLDVRADFIKNIFEQFDIKLKFPSWAY